ncbi:MULTISPECIES: translin family protein [Candidatus Nitrosocaldus]|jgi:translin|uniref:RNA-binding protein n=1 Tax=Candidatus Nitrosocaldus cavascurensis TaxID=2058097 RepID=A0A2K5APF4_9ARCH|nr:MULTISPECIES: RNA-binding protein [Candidatus Nitrosocaldus]SPC33516.1 RNA-binding protein [Candidatus Nitrosocaldus cavascurensis]
MGDVDYLKEPLDRIMEMLKAIEERRERLIKGTRDVVMLCSKAIVNIHASDLNTAGEQIVRAANMMDELKHVAEEYPNLQAYLVGAEAELVEARALYSIVREHRVPIIDGLSMTSMKAYLLGLLDCIGELKRQVYDRVREGKGSDALRLFSMMEALYAMLLPFSAYDNIVQGVKRKVDVARILIEDVRAMLTEEVRRSSMLEVMQRMEMMVEKEKSIGVGREEKEESNKEKRMEEGDE